MHGLHFRLLSFRSQHVRDDQCKMNHFASNSSTQHNTTQHNTMKHNKPQHNTTQHNTTQHNTIQHNKTQHNITQHNTTQHNTKQQHKTTTKQKNDRTPLSQIFRRPLWKIIGYKCFIQNATHLLRRCCGLPKQRNLPLTMIPSRVHNASHSSMLQKIWQIMLFSINI